MLDWTFGLSAVLATSIGLIYRGQQFLVYMPNYPKESRTKIETPSRYGILDYEEITISCEDKINIQAYLILSDKEKKDPNLTMIYFHANAGNLGHRLPIASKLYRMLNCNILMVSYRGYGKSEGEPSEEGIKLDSQASLEYILNHPILKYNKVILYGQSIGGAVAIHLANENKESIHGLIVENTFLSLPSLLNTLLPMGNFMSILLSQNWDNESIIQNINQIPMLFLSGDKDQLIHPSHMEKLFALAAQNSDSGKCFVSIKDGTHNDTCTHSTYYKAILDFLMKNRFL